MVGMWYVACSLGYVAAVGVVYYPVADVVQSRRVAVHIASAVAYAFKVVDKVAPRAASFAYRICHGHYGLDKSCAVKSVKVDSKFFFTVTFQCAAYIRSVHEFSA